MLYSLSFLVNKQAKLFSFFLFCKSTEGQLKLLKEGKKKVIFTIAISPFTVCFDPYVMMRVENKKGGEFSLVFWYTSLTEKEALNLSLLALFSTSVITLISEGQFYFATSKVKFLNAEMKLQN